MKDNKKMQMLENVINFNYGIQVESIQLLREMIARVYLISSKQKKYILKQYRENTKINVNQMTLVMDFLYNKGSHVPKIYRNKDGFLLTKHEN